MPLATLTSKGQLTIPKQIRQYLSIDTGDKVEFIIDEDGRVVITAKTLRVKDIFGMLDAKKHISLDDMKNAIQQRMKRKFSHHERN